MKMDFLIGSTFPLVLIRREVRIRPYSIDVLKKLGQNSICHSFWGHSNTIAPANKILGFDVSPKLERPVLTLTDKGLPTLDGIVFMECWVLSPDYVENFRPKIGVEVPAEKIQAWKALNIKWEDDFVC